MKHIKLLNVLLLDLEEIFDYKDALEYIFSGALFVSVGSAIYYDYKIPEKIIFDLENYLKNEKLDNHLPLVGIAVKQVYLGKIFENID